MNYNPFEIACSGYSGSGKTFLITRLIEFFSNKYTVGYAKHGSHGFEIDREGKDTYKAKKSGASQVLIKGGNRHACISSRPLGMHLLESDIVLVEGHKESDIEKIIVIDENKKIFQAIKEKTCPNVIAFVGQDSLKPSLPIDRPYFHRDDIESIAKCIENRWIRAIPPLYGLVLAGGKSSRMGEDKALLQYHHKNQAEVSFDLLSSLCDCVYVSRRRDQIGNEKLSHLPLQYDRFLEMGPLGGILTAMKEHRQASWLVVACDLPLLSREAIQELIDERDPFKLATCYLSEVDNLPEPLCAIYEPKSYPQLLTFLGQGYVCPRKALTHSNAKKIDLLHKMNLHNCNTPEDRVSLSL